MNEMMGGEKLILGTVQFGLPYGINNNRGKPEVKDVLGILAEATARGIRTLDTAVDYGVAHSVLGEFFREHGKTFDVDTKFRVKEGVPVKQGLEEILEQLNIDYVDTLFFHRFNDLKGNPEVVEELSNLKKEGYIKKRGVSVYTNEEFKECIQGESIDVIQIPFNLLDNFKKRGELLVQAKAANKEIHARSIFLQGLFFKEMETYPPCLVPLRKYVTDLKFIAREYHLSMEQLALLYAYGKNEIDRIIIGVDSKAQLVANCEALTIPFSKETEERIDLIDVTEEALLHPYNWK